jgi:hypothetical protein
MMTEIARDDVQRLMAQGGHPRCHRDFHAALRSAAKTVEAVRYEGGRHNDIFGKPSPREDQVKQIVAFLLRHLRE